MSLDEELRSMAESFVVESMIPGYHEYKSIWDSPVNGEELNCVREIGNSHDLTAVAKVSKLSMALFVLKPAFRLLGSRSCWLAVLPKEAISKTTNRLDLVSHPKASEHVESTSKSTF